MPHTYQCLIITKARPIESFEGEKNEVVTQLFKMRQFIPIKWYWYNSFESFSHNMSTRINNHKMCTKGSFIFLNHVHSYMELPICGVRLRAMNLQTPNIVTTTQNSHYYYYYFTRTLDTLAPLAGCNIASWLKINIAVPSLYIMCQQCPLTNQICVDLTMTRTVEALVCHWLHSVMPYHNLLGTLIPVSPLYDGSGPQSVACVWLWLYRPIRDAQSWPQTWHRNMSMFDEGSIAFRLILLSLREWQLFSS